MSLSLFAVKPSNHSAVYLHEMVKHRHDTSRNAISRVVGSHLGTGTCGIMALSDSYQFLKYGSYATATRQFLLGITLLFIGVIIGPERAVQVQRALGLESKTIMAQIFQTALAHRKVLLGALAVASVLAFAIRHIRSAKPLDPHIPVQQPNQPWISPTEGVLWILIWGVFLPTWLAFALRENRARAKRLAEAEAANTG